MTPEEEEYREGLRRTGVVVPIDVAAPFRPSLDDALGMLSRSKDPVVSTAVGLGVFGDALILPPDQDAIRRVSAAVSVLARDQSIDVSARVMASDLSIRISAATAGMMPAACVRSPCGVNDPKVEQAQLERARREVGAPKPKVDRPDGLLYVAYGVGVDSTAILVGLAQIVREGRRDFRPDYIVFADTGVEKQVTYDFIDVVNRWLDKVGFPRVQVVAYATEFAAKSFGSSRTLEQQVLLTQHMPAYSATKTSRATCSMLWKQAAQQRWLERQPDLYEQVGSRSYAPKRGLRITKAIGYDAEETARREHGDTFRVDDDKRLYEERGLVNPFSYWFPLMDWGWDRARCVAEIEAEIGVVPPKSSCFFCGAMKKNEIAALPKEELLRALLVEQVALNGWHAEDYAANKNKGLGMNFSWTEFALEEGLITRREHAALMKKALEIAALPQERRSEGGENLADHPVIRRLPAFRDVLGMRDRYGPIWDRFSEIADDKKAGV